MATKSNGLAPIETPLAQRIADFQRGPMIFIVWIVAAVVTLSMLSQRAGDFEHVGIARAMQYEISATTTGRLDALLVDRFERVEAGDLIAQLDATALEARIATTRASMDQITAEIERARVRLAASTGSDIVDQVADLRRFQIDETQLHLDAVALEVALETDRIERERLALRLTRVTDLRDEGVATEAEVDEARLAHEEVARRIEMNESLRRRTEQEHRAAQTRREEFEASLPETPAEEPLLLALRESVRVESLRLEEIEIERRGLMLRSPVSGQVSEILARGGQAIVPGELVASVTIEEPAGVICYIAASQMNTPAVNTRALVSRVSEPRVTAESLVARVGPAVETLPERLWRNPTVPEHGVPVLLAAIPGLALTPGEPVRVHFLD